MPPSPNNRLAISPQQQLLLLLLRAEENEVVVAFDEDANAWLSARRMFLLLRTSFVARGLQSDEHIFAKNIKNFQDVDDDTNTISTRGRNRRLCVVPILSFWRRYV